MNIPFLYFQPDQDNIVLLLIMVPLVTLKHLGLETQQDQDNSDIRTETNLNPSHHFLICTIIHDFSQHDASKDGFFPKIRR